MSRYSPYQFALFRILFGSGLVVHLFALVLNAGERFSLIPAYGLVPRLLLRADSPGGARVGLVALGLLAVLFTLGWHRRIGALLLWCAWACLVDWNLLIDHPGLSFAGWLLLACTILPAGEPLSVRAGRTGRPWVMPQPLYWGVWFLMAAGYTASGLHKLQSPGWLDGRALAMVLDHPLAGSHLLRDGLRALPPWALRIMTWSALGLEIGFLPLGLFRAARPWLWLLSILLHLGIPGVVAFPDLTLGVLMIHLFTFDAGWVGPARAEDRPIVFFDGVCGLCNGFVDFAIGEDHGRHLRFAPLQGQAARGLLDPAALETLDSVVLVAGGRTYRQSAAILRILAHLGGLWRVLGILGRLAPRAALDPVYGFIARHRYRWFPRRAACRLPSPEERACFLE